MASIAMPQAGGNRFSRLVTDQNYMWWAALTVILGMFIVIMDASIVNVALPHIMSAFGSNLEEIEWVSTGYMLASAVMMPTTGFLGDRFGRKRLYATTVLLFTLASVLCGLAWDNTSLVLFRVLQGVVGGAIQPVGQAILFEAFPPNKRGMSMALVGIGAMLAPALGPTIGGYLVDYLSWRWIFFINLPIGLFCALLAARVLRESHLKAVRFDGWGFMFMATFLTTLLLAVSQGNSKGWDTYYIVGMFGAAALSFAAFLVTSLWRSEPIVDLSLYKYPVYTAGTIVSIIVGAGLFGGVFLLPLFLQNLMGYDAFTTGLILMPQGLMMGFIMPISGALMNRIPVRVQLSLGLGCMGLSMFLQAGMTPDTNLWVIISWTLIRSVGMALSFPAMNQTALGAVPIQKIGMASGLFNVTRQVGGTFAIAAFATLLTQRQVFHMAILGQDVAHNGVAARMIPGMAQWLVSHGSAPWMARMQAGAMMAMTTGKQAMVYAFQDVFWVAGIVSLLGIVPAMMMSKPPQTQGAPGGAGHQPMMAE